MSHAGTVFTSIRLLKITVPPGLLCKIFSWNLRSKFSKPPFKKFVFIAA